MSHLHLPDGVLPWWLWLGALATTLVAVLAALKRLEGRRRMLPAVAVMAAASLAAANIPLGLPLHVNLAALAGIVLGPALGFLAVFVANVFNTLIGHGGLTVLGVNALLVGSEALAAGGLFRLLGGSRRLLLNTCLSVLAALLLSLALAAAVAGAAGVELEALASHVHNGRHAPAGAGEFWATFVAIMAPLAAVWLAVELALTLLIVGYVRKVRGGWLERG